LAAGGNILAGHDNVLLQVKNSNSVEKVSSENANWPLRSLWFISNRNYYISGSGIYQKHFLDENAWKNDIYLITTYSTNRIRGREINDIVATGGAGELIHFNGNYWKSFIDVVGIPGNYYGTAIFNNTIVTVGQSSNRAILTIGRR
ncbi:MAG: glucosyl transferase, partial [Ignavibacteriaceae bacterium]|nr:glucosyl transferase [Ignavibacteriaceae bacterium]